jgi:hypothetical protein
MPASVPPVHTYRLAHCRVKSERVVHAHSRPAVGASGEAAASKGAGAERVILSQEKAGSNAPERCSGQNADRRHLVVLRLLASLPAVQRLRTVELRVASSLTRSLERSDSGGHLRQAMMMNMMRK